MYSEQANLAAFQTDSQQPETSHKYYRCRLMGNGRSHCMLITAALTKTEPPVFAQNGEQEVQEEDK